jgi:hypothetical protein
VRTTTMSAEQIRKAGLRALARELGPSGMARFLQQFGVGNGDYTKMRDELIGEWDMDEWMKRIRQTRKAKSGKRHPDQ